MKYYPILLSKAGELTALRRLSQKVKNETTPIIQILDSHFDNVSNMLVDDWTFPNNSVIVDFSLLTSANNDIIAIENLLRLMTAAGVNVIPTVDINSSTQYVHLIQYLATHLNVSVCLRTSDNSGGFIDYNTHIYNLSSSLIIPNQNLMLLLDFGLVGLNNYINIANLASGVLNLIANPSDYQEIIIASGSFPQDLSSLSANNIHFLQRYEWIIWGTIQKQNTLPIQIKYSDYGTKHPIYTEANFLGSCSIKYSTDLNFVIYRGELSPNHELGNGQYINFSKQLVLNQHYYGPNFSWGDNKINLMAAQSVNPPHNPGNAKTWVEISQNHHVTLLESLL